MNGFAINSVTTRARSVVSALAATTAYGAGSGAFVRITARQSDPS